jgi:hypothetical protein
VAPFAPHGCRLRLVGRIIDHESIKWRLKKARSNWSPIQARERQLPLLLGQRAELFSLSLVAEFNGRPKLVTAVLTKYHGPPGI